MQRTLEEQKAIIDNAIGVLDSQIAHIRMLRAINAELLAALKDMYGGWRYIRQTHGDLYGVGWDRAENKAFLAMAAAEQGKYPAAHGTTSNPSTTTE